MVASVSGNNKIVLKGDYGQFEEGILSGAASPGMNVVMTPAAAQLERDTYTAGATEVGSVGGGPLNAPIKLVREDSLQGKTIHDAYESGDIVFLYLPKKGDVVQVLVASGQDIDKGETLAAGADGKWVTGGANDVLEALEDTGGALAEDTLVRARVM